MDRDQNRAVLRAYWKRTLRLTLTLLAVWFTAGYVVAILMAPTLNRVTFLGGPLGFWFAQNGAIYVFWVLILVYAVGMNRLDHEFDVEEDR
jgi:putative solute:sodium symporter small subunit